MTEFLSMGGYGVYVWSAFAITLGMFVCEYFIVRSRYKKTLQRIKRIQQFNQQSPKGKQS